MNINVEKTKEYYQNDVPCNCLDCRNFFLQIETKYPNLCDYFRSIGVDPKKPLELIPINEGNQLIYLECMYVVIGECQENEIVEMDGIKVTKLQEGYPIVDTKEEYFVVNFGPISLPNLLYHNIEGTKKKKKSNQSFVYESPLSKKDLYQRIIERKHANCVQNGEDYLIDIKNDLIWIGIEKGGHSGWWYVGKTYELDGKSLITGQIVYNPDDDGNPKFYKRSLKDKIGNILIFILLLPLLLLLLPFYFLWWLYKKLSKKTFQTMSREERLDFFFVNQMSCKRIG